MTVIVDLTAATICFLNTCFPVLIGKTTPVGIFDMNLRITAQEGYGGDIIQFDETKDLVMAIHRVWLLNPKQRRPERLESSTVKDNTVTNGCINVKPDVYDKLKECCIRDKLIIIKGDLK